MKLRCLIAAALAVATTALVPATCLATPPRASLTDIENDVMCPSCREPLALAQSPQAYRERAYIVALIAQGDTKAQIERALVAQYGPAVLGRPPASGFNLAVYVLPPAVVLAGLMLLAVTLPRWRKRSRAPAPPLAAAPRIDPADARRLEDDLARYEG
jgi:cytochrome c-type biogenesis protein CcmH